MASCFKLIVCAGDHHSHDLAIAAAGNEEVCDLVTVHFIFSINFQLVHGCIDP